jgi:hypothetical protein
MRGCSSTGRAPALQAGGRGFDPHQLHGGTAMPDRADEARSGIADAAVRGFAGTRNGL